MGMFQQLIAHPPSGEFPAKREATHCEHPRDQNPQGDHSIFGLPGIRQRQRKC